MADVGRPQPVRYSHGAFQILSRDVLVMLVQIVTGAVIARALGPRWMGIWIMLQMIPSYAEALGRLQVDSAACYFLNRGRYRVEHVAFATIVVSLVTSSVLIVAFLWSEAWLYRTYLTELAGFRWYVYVVLACIPLRFVGLNYSYLLLAEHDVRGFNTMAALNGLVPSVLGAVLLLVAGLGGLVAAMFLGTLVALVYGARRLPVPRPHADGALFTDLLRFGSTLYLHSVIGYLHTYGSSLIVLGSLSSAQLAFFRLGQDRASLLARIPTAVGTLLFPRSSALGDAEAREMLARSVRTVLVVLLACGVAALALARPAVFLLYGASFAGVVTPLLIFVPGIIADGASALVIQYLIGRGRLWPVVCASLGGLAIQLSLLFVAVPRWGVTGAAAAASLGFVLTALLRVAIVRAIDGVSVASLIPRWTDVVFVVNFVRDRVRPWLPAHVQTQ
jgi:O-antigen/teichoic acid export membrane protein